MRGWALPAALMLVCSLYGGGVARAEPWSPVASRGVFRQAHAVAKLSSGRLLVAGGQYEPTLSLVEMFDPKTFEWTPVPTMKEGRAYFCAVPLDGGKRVFVAGGTVTQIGGTGPTGARSTAEIYDETTNTWTSVKPMSDGRNDHLCAPLPDGRILVVGGTGATVPALSTVEIYDPKTDAWTPGPPLSIEVNAARGAVVEGGDVFVISTGQAWRWSSSTSTWIAAAPTRTLPTKVRLAKLDDGRILIVGEGPPDGVIYDPVAKAFRDLPALPTRHLGPTIVALPGNRALVTGGVDPKTSKVISAVEIFDGATNTWTAAPPMLLPRFTHAAMPIDPARAILIGGTTGGPEEVWNALPGTVCARDEECGSGACVDKRCCDKRCDGACEACDVKGKEGTCSPIDGAPRAGHATCAPYATCNAGICASTCAADTDCSSDNVCFATLHRCGPARGVCNADGDVVSPTGTKTACAPFVCGPTGECLSECATTLDCAKGSACDTTSRKCSPATPRSSEEEGGCATSTSSRGYAGFVIALALLLAWKRRTGALSALLVIGFATSARAATFRPTQPMTNPNRLYATSNRLDDGRVIVAGGCCSSTDPGRAETTVELYDAATDKWLQRPGMKSPRSGHSSALLKDGRVLLIGGRVDVKSAPLASVDIFDPASGTFSAAPPIPTARLLSLAITLSDGRVLVAGGVGAGDKPLTDALLFDPATSTWTSAGTMSTPHAFGTIALLPDGRVLVAGGAAPKKVDIFDVSKGSWSAGPDMTSSHNEASSVVLADGRVVVVGDGTVADVFDPGASTWSVLASGLLRRSGATASLLPSGEILIVGGGAMDGSTLERTTELVDPSKKTVRPGPSLAAPRSSHTATSLADGRVLIAGGVSTTDESLPILSQPVVFQLLDGSPCGKDTDCASSFCTDGRCCGTRCRDACSACDVTPGTCAPISGKQRKDHASCSPFGVCVAGGCAAICGTDDYCDEQHVCDVATGTCVEPKGTCEGDVAIDTLSGERKSCAPYHCARGKCASRCSTTTDCVGGALCDQGSCVRPGENDDAGGCAYGSRSGSAIAALLLLAATLYRASMRVRRP
jgi:hypothetical protein